MLSGPGIDRTPAKVKPIYPRLGQGRRVGPAILIASSSCKLVASFRIPACLSNLSQSLQFVANASIQRRSGRVLKSGVQDGLGDFTGHKRLSAKSRPDRLSESNGTGSGNSGFRRIELPTAVNCFWRLVPEFGDERRPNAALQFNFPLQGREALIKDSKLGVALGDLGKGLLLLGIVFHGGTWYGPITFKATGT